MKGFDLEAVSAIAEEAACDPNDEYMQALDKDVLMVLLRSVL